MKTLTIGWIGLGKMGVPMSKRLIEAGYKLSVYNRTASKESALKALGATSESSPNLLIQNTDIVIIMVSDDQAIEEIFKGEQGLLNATTKGKIIINMSTVSPSISIEMAKLLAQRGNYYIDAPVSGSIKQAEEATLVIMAGGNKKVFDQVQSVLETIGRLAIRVGDVGAGNKAKLAINTLLGIYMQGLTEVILFSQQQGLKTDDLITLINNSALASPLLKIKNEAILNENYTAAFALKHLAKDLRLAKDLGLSNPLSTAAYKSYQDAEEKYGNEDIISIIKHLNK